MTLAPPACLGVDAAVARSAGLDAERVILTGALAEAVGVMATGADGPLLEG